MTSAGLWAFIAKSPLQSRKSLATLMGVMCSMSQCELRSTFPNLRVTNVIRIVTFYTLPPLESPTSSWMTRSQRSRRRDKGLLSRCPAILLFLLFLPSPCFSLNFLVFHICLCFCTLNVSTNRTILQILELHEFSCEYQNIAHFATIICEKLKTLQT